MSEWSHCCQQLLMLFVLVLLLFHFLSMKIACQTPFQMLLRLQMTVLWYFLMLLNTFFLHLIYHSSLLYSGVEIESGLCLQMEEQEYKEHDYVECSLEVLAEIYQGSSAEVLEFYIKFCVNVLLQFRLVVITRFIFHHVRFLYPSVVKVYAFLGN